MLGKVINVSSYSKLLAFALKKIISKVLSSSCIDITTFFSANKHT